MLKKVLINIGEFAALGGLFTLGISDPAYGLVGTTKLSNRAVATSSLAACQAIRVQRLWIIPVWCTKFPNGGVSFEPFLWCPRTL